MKKTILPVLALVSLLFVGMLPVVEAPHNRTWDIRYQANNVLPENDGWTRGTLGNVYREFIFNDQILRVNFTSGDLGTEQYTRSDLEDSTMYLIEARIHVNNTMMSGFITFRLESSTGGETLGIQIFDPFTKICRDVTCFTYHTQNITNANHTWRFIVWRDSSAEKMAVSAYLDEYYLGFRHSSISGYYYYDTIRWRMDYENDVPDLKIDTDYILIRTNNTEDYLLDELAERDAEIDDLEDEIDDLKRELDRLRRRLDQIDDGVIIVGENEPYVPPTREGLESDPSGYFFVDPFWTIFFDWHDSKAVGASMSFVACYDSGWSDYEALEDILYIAGSYTTLWLNSSGSEVLNTTDAYTYYKIPDANAGDAYTVETSGGNIKTDRYCRMKRVETFSWMVSEDKKDYKHTFALTNDLSVDWRNILWVIAADPDTTMDQSTVVVTDTTTNTELDPGKHYEITPSCIRFQLSYHNQTVSESYEVEYSTFQEGSEYQEPRGIFNYDVASSASLNNRVYLFDEVAISNPNSIKVSVGTRITIQMSSIPGTINEVYVITADGSHLTQGPPLGNKWYTFYGLEIPANSVVTVSVYVKAPEPTLSPGWFQLHGVWLFAVSFMFLILCFVGWMWSVTVKGMKKYSGTIASAFWVSAICTLVFGVLTYLAGG